jgi:hypothetical protein
MNAIANGADGFVIQLERAGLLRLRSGDDDSERVPAEPPVPGSHEPISNRRMARLTCQRRSAKAQSVREDSSARHQSGEVSERRGGTEPIPVDSRPGRVTALGSGAGGSAIREPLTARWHGCSIRVFGEGKLEIPLKGPSGDAQGSKMAALRLSAHVSCGSKPRNVKKYRRDG